MKTPKIKYLPVVVAPLLITSCSSDNEGSQAFPDTNPTAPPGLLAFLGNLLGHPILGSVILIAAVAAFVGSRWVENFDYPESTDHADYLKYASLLAGPVGLVLIFATLLH